MTNPLLNAVCRNFTPFIFLFGVYVFLGGKTSSGGGFQSGAIWASGLIFHSLVFGVERTKKIISVRFLQFLACSGVLIYSGYGLLMIILGGRFLQYNAILSSAHQAQTLGVMIVEIGAHLTVFATLSLMFWRLSRV